MGNFAMEEDNMDFFSTSDVPCKKHPYSSSVGVCAQCLKERLMSLVCSDCGEQRLSSCSCSDISCSYRNSCNFEVGSVGRISFLLDNECNSFGNRHFEKSESDFPKNLLDTEGLCTGYGLKRSNSCCVEVKKKKNSFWRIGKFFGKKKVKGSEADEENCEVWMSRSMCSFRGQKGNFTCQDQETGDFVSASAKVSNFSEESEVWMPRSLCSFKGHKVIFADPDQEPVNTGCASAKVTNFSTSSEASKKKGTFQESEFDEMDDSGISGFIDLELGLATESKPEYPVLRKNEVFPVSVSEFDNLREDILSSIKNGGSCRITLNEKGIKKRSKSKGQKVWSWIVKHQHGWKPSPRKKDVVCIVES